MKKYILLVLASMLMLASCKEEIKEVKKAKPENLVEIKNGVFTQYYPGKKQVKFQGAQDNKGNRHGKWVFYGETGLELSIGLYDHGKKHGHSIVKYPNGALYYVGEYHQDQKIGVWTTYDQKGNVIQEKDFGPAK